MTFDDYISCRKMDLLIETFHNNALFEELFLSLEKLGIPIAIIMATNAITISSSNSVNP